LLKPWAGKSKASLYPPPQLSKTATRKVRNGKSRAIAA
jgi:hypothetical protein